MIHETPRLYGLSRHSAFPPPAPAMPTFIVNGEHFGIYLNIETLDDDLPGEAIRLAPGTASASLRGRVLRTTCGLADVGNFEIDEGRGRPQRPRPRLIDGGGGSPAPSTSPTGVGPRRRSRRDDADVGRGEVHRPLGRLLRGGRTSATSCPTTTTSTATAAGVFQMMPWGTDPTWADRSVGFAETAGLLFNGCRADPSCAARYHRALRAVLAEVDAAFDSAAVTTAALLKPWQELELGSGGRHEYSLGEIDTAVAATRGFIGSRPDDLADYLASVPEVPGLQIELDLQPDSIVADGQSTTTATATVSDAYGNPAFGDAVEFSSTDPSQTLGAVTNHGDGTCTVLITSSTAAGAPTISAADESVDPDLSDTRSSPRRWEPPLRSSSAFSPTRSPPTASRRRPLRRNRGRLRQSRAGDTVQFSSTDPGQQIGPVSDRTTAPTPSRSPPRRLPAGRRSPSARVGRSGHLRVRHPGQASIASPPPVVSPPTILHPPSRRSPGSPPGAPASHAGLRVRLRSARCDLPLPGRRSPSAGLHLSEKARQLGPGPHAFSVAPSAAMVRWGPPPSTSSSSSHPSNASRAGASCSSCRLSRLVDGKATRAIGT